MIIASRREFIVSKRDIILSRRMYKESRRMIIGSRGMTDAGDCCSHLMPGPAPAPQVRFATPCPQMVAASPSSSLQNSRSARSQRAVSAV